MLDTEFFHNIEDTDGGLFKTRDLSAGIMILGYQGTNPIIKIPETINGKPVKAIVTFSASPFSEPYKIFVPSSVILIMGTYREKGWANNVCISPDNTHLVLQDGLVLSKDKSMVFLTYDDTLKEISLPDETERIYSYAFYPCRELVSIRLGKNAAKFDKCAFPYTGAGSMRAHGKVSGHLPTALERIMVSNENDTFTSVDGFLYSKDMGTLLAAPEVIPGGIVELPEKTVRIAAEAMKGNQGIKKLIVRHDLEEVEASAFEDCFSLETVALAGVNVIGKGAFCECIALTSVGIEKADVIGYNAFSGCERLEAAKIGSASIIDNGAFYSCAELQEMILPKNLKTIKDLAFAQTKLKTVSVPISVESLGEQAFYGCDGLTIELYDTLKSMSGKLAYSWDSLNDRWECAQHRIVVKNSRDDTIRYVVYMGKSNGTSSKYREIVVNGWSNYPSFDFASLDANYTSLTDAEEKMEVATLRLKYPVELSDAAKKAYEDYLKRSAKKLMSMCIGNRDLESAAFYGQLGILKQETINAAIEECSAREQPEMMALLLDLQNQTPGKVKKQINSLSLSSKVKAEWETHKDSPALLSRYLGNETEIVFPSEVKGVTITGLANASTKLPENYLNITSVVIPEGYTVLGNNAFNGCEKLESVTLPSTLQHIGKNCFKDCKALKQIEIPASVTDIDDYAFFGTGIKAFELHSNTILGDLSLGSAETLIAHGASTGCFINNHYIANCLKYVYSDGKVSGSGIPSGAIMPLSYVDIGIEDLLKNSNPEILKGKNVYCLGQLKGLPKGIPYFRRAQFPEFVEKLGGTYAAKFGKDTNIVVAQQIDPEQATIQKAKKQGALVLTELEFLTMIKEQKCF